MKKNRVVSFDEYGAWIDKVSKDSLDSYKDNKDVLINPKMNHLKGIPMEFWKRDGDSIVEMTRPEKVEQIKLLSQSIRFKNKQNQQAEVVKYIDRNIIVEKKIFDKRYGLMFFCLGLLVGLCLIIMM